ncbi:MAG: protoporphyrinogen oxidase [Verrucomicrobia bacterium]|nr:protoporphyrinogen oxidase [Verrucomicrobiota bacterium]
MTGAIQKHAIIVGGGIGGLATAHRLLQSANPPRVTLIDAGARLGGVIETRQTDGFTMECGPDSLIRTKASAARLAEELGIPAEDVVDTCPDARSCYIVHRGRLRPLPDGFYLMVPGKLLPWIKTPLVSWPGKFRALLDLVLPRGGSNDESLASFVQRRLGQEVLDRLAQPLVAGIYGADPEQLSLRATMPQFIEMERHHRSLLLGMRAQRSRMQTQGSSGARYSLFYSFRGGLKHLVNALEVSLADRLTIKRNTVAARVSREGESSWAVTTDKGETLQADLLFLALPAWQAAALLDETQAALGELLRNVPYGSVATINLAYAAHQIPNLPKASGFVVPRAESESIIACTFSHQKYPGRAPDDMILLRAFVGGAGREAGEETDDPTLCKTVTRELEKWLNIEGQPAFSLISRYTKRMAQYTCGHLARVQSIRVAESHLAGLALIGNGYEGVGISDIIEQANKAVERLCSTMPEQS